MRFRTRPSRKLVIKVMERHITFKFAPSADEPSKGMITEAVSTGFYSSKFWNRDYPRVHPVPTSWVAPAGCYARASGADPAKNACRQARFSLLYWLYTQLWVLSISWARPRPSSHRYPLWGRYPIQDAIAGRWADKSEMNV